MATSNTTTRTERQAGRPVRQLPAYQIVRRYRYAGYTQGRIAELARTSQSTVTNAIRRAGSGPAVERVWAILEEILA